VLSIRLPVNSRLVVEFLGSQSYLHVFDCMGGWVERKGTANPHAVQASTVL